MNKTVLTSFTILCLLSTVFLIGIKTSVKGNAELPVHNVDTGLDYAAIQEAIDANETLDGHIIFVDEGTYHEHVVVAKSLRLIGENKDTTVIDGDGFGNVVNLFQEENVSISGFTIRNSGPTFDDYGILICYSSNITVYGNVLTENTDGIRLISSTDSNVFNNSITDNKHRGIDLTTSSHNTVSRNNFTNNMDAVCLYQSHNNTLSRNTALNSSDFGVVLWVSRNNTLLDNIVSDNWRGIGLNEASDNTLRSNLMINNTQNFGLSFANLEDCLNNVDTSNLVNGKPVYYWIDKHSDDVPLDAGYIALVNCTNITVNNLTLENNSQGIVLANTNQSLVTCNGVTENFYGVTLALSYNNTVLSNIIASNQYYGIVFFGNSCNNRVIANNFSNNWAGIYLDHSNANTVFHNNFISNSKQIDSHDSTNVWDNGFEGNYWSNYTGVDSDHDGLGDTDHVIDASNIDHCPLMGMFSSFNTSLGKYVRVISNSTIESFEYFESNSTIRIHGSNMASNQTFGFCRVCIPKNLIAPNYTVTIDEIEPYYVNYTLYDNGTHRWIYFSYEHSIVEIIIVPEFSSFLILPLFMIAALLAVIVYKKKKSNFVPQRLS